MAKSLTCMLMSGPLLTGYTQTINDYYDKEIDAINEPNRPIPSGTQQLGQTFPHRNTLCFLSPDMELTMTGKAVAYPRGMSLQCVLHSLPAEQLKQQSTVWLSHHMYTKLRLSSMCRNLHCRMWTVSDRMAQLQKPVLPYQQNYQSAR